MANQEIGALLRFLSQLGTNQPPVQGGLLGVLGGKGAGSNDEDAFQSWYKGWAEKAGLDPNPDDPRHFYDWRAAFKAGATPQIDPGDGRLHWPSQYKRDEHPNRIIEGIDTRTGQPVAPTTGLD